MLHNNNCYISITLGHIVDIYLNILHISHTYIPPPPFSLSLSLSLSLSTHSVSSPPPYLCIYYIYLSIYLYIFIFSVPICYFVECVKVELDRDILIFFLEKKSMHLICLADRATTLGKGLIIFISFFCITD